jgi:enoyl-CoA hydratase/carnithine racemase
MTGARIYAARCESIGLANRIVTDDDPAAVDDAAFALAKELADGPHFALRMTKTMLQRELEMPLAQAIEAEAQAQAVCMQHPDFKEANAAWREKRPPQWK